MSMEIKLKEVDLHSIKVKRREDEQSATNELVCQILGWMKENGKPISRVNTLIMNKLVYFSMQEIRKTNNSLLITNGWYKYGPCYEELRVREGPDRIEDYSKFNPRAGYLDEVNTVCSREFPLFEKSSCVDASTSVKEQYYYTYLKHVYLDLVPPKLKWLQTYYQSKHELEYLMYCLAFDLSNLNDDKSSLQEQFSECLFQFESAICDTDYEEHVKLNGLQDITLRFSAILEPVFNDYCLSTTRQKDPVLDSIVGRVAIFFDGDILMPFAYENLIATYESPFENVLVSKKKTFAKTADKLTEKIRLKLFDMVYDLKKHGLM